MRLVLVVVITVTIISCINDNITLQNNESLVVGDTIPDFSVKMNDGRVITGDSLRGSVSVIVFFSYILS